MRPAEFSMVFVLGRLAWCTPARCLVVQMDCLAPAAPLLRRTAEAIAEFVTERSGLPVGKIERTPLISAR